MLSSTVHLHRIIRPQAGHCVSTPTSTTGLRWPRNSDPCPSSPDTRPPGGWSQSVQRPTRDSISGVWSPSRTTFSVANVTYVQSKVIATQRNRILKLIYCSPTDAKSARIWSSTESETEQSTEDVTVSINCQCHCGIQLSTSPISTYLEFSIVSSRHCYSFRYSSLTPIQAVLMDPMGNYVKLSTGHNECLFLLAVLA